MSRVVIEDGFLHVGSRRILLIAGEIRFWRMEPETWRPAVEAARAAGVTMVSTYHDAIAAGAPGVPGSEAVPFRSQRAAIRLTPGHHVYTLAYERP